MMLAMCSDGSTPILQIQCDPLGNGCERILHTATEKTKQISLVKMWLSKFIIITLA